MSAIGTIEIPGSPPLSIVPTGLTGRESVSAPGVELLGYRQSSLTGLGESEEAQSALNTCVCISRNALMEYAGPSYLKGQGLGE